MKSSPKPQEKAQPQDLLRFFAELFDKSDLLNIPVCKDLDGLNVKVNSVIQTTDSKGPVLTAFLTNGQSVKLRAELFGRPS